VIRLCGSAKGSGACLALSRNVKLISQFGDVGLDGFPDLR